VNVPPRIDVVIDNHNYDRYLRTAIDSALAQRGVGDVIVVDDGSTDDSPEIIRSYGGQVTAVFKENGGQASALNAGWAVSRSGVVIFLDADDVLLPDAVERVARAFAATPAAVKVQYRMMVIDGSGTPTGEVMPPAHVHLPTGDLRRSELTFPFDLPWMATSGNAFAADALRRIMPIPEQEFAASADWYLRHVVSLLGEVVSLSDICACYRVHDSNSYARAGTSIDIAKIRATVRFAAATQRHLMRVADEVGLAPAPRPILSVADLGNRLISKKLDPDAHPLADDRVSRLAVDGAIAAVRRFDVRWPKKLVFIGWFAATALAPRRACGRLAGIFLFPERRPRVSRLLGRLKDQRRAVQGSAAHE
jgi:glycosyltransferase involved in cell wall biosynthesis